MGRGITNTVWPLSLLPWEFPEPWARERLAHWKTTTAQRAEARRKGGGAELESGHRADHLVLPAYVLALIETPTVGLGGCLMPQEGGAPNCLWTEARALGTLPELTLPFSSIWLFLSCALYDKTITLCTVLSGVLGVIVTNHQASREVM